MSGLKCPKCNGRLVHKLSLRAYGGDKMLCLDCRRIVNRPKEVAPADGIEPPRAVLETAVLPLNEAGIGPAWQN